MNINCTFAKLLVAVHVSQLDGLDKTIEAAAIFCGFYREGAAMSLTETGENVRVDSLERLNAFAGSYRHQAAMNGWERQHDDPRDDPA